MTSIRIRHTVYVVKFSKLKTEYVAEKMYFNSAYMYFLLFGLNTVDLKI